VPGYRDFSFSASGVFDPTGEKAMHNLWYADGIWWGALFNRASETFDIYRLDWSSQTWSDTGTQIDDRNYAKSDTLWTGQKLYVLSSGYSTSYATHAGRLRRYSYNSATKAYTLDAGFPVTVTQRGGEVMTLDRDSTGKLWLTYMRGNKIYVNRSLGSDTSWGTEFIVPGAASVNGDDISALIAYDGKIGVVWSNQNTGAFYWAVHVDGAADTSWQPIQTIAQGTELADDHLSLVAIPNDPAGKVFIAAKTSLDGLSSSSPSDPQIVLFALRNDGSWTQSTIGRISDQHTRPVLVYDSDHRQLDVFMTSPFAGGIIYMKSASLDTLSFPVGLGTPFISNKTDKHLNNVSSTRQPVNGSTGLVVIASDANTFYYEHNTLLR
jgi:hypothetical protein